MRRAIGAGIAVLIVVALAVAWWSTGADVEDGSVLVVELAGQVTEAPPVDALARLTAPGPALPTLLLLLEMAERDERVVAVLLHIRPLAIGYAQLQELRDAVARVRNAGKQVLAVLDLAVVNATRELYLASAADRVYVVPGFVGPFAGIAGQSIFLGSFFEKIGVDVEYVRVGDYKSAVETFADSEMSEPARQMMNELLDGLFAQITTGIAEGRGLSAEAVAALIEKAPATGPEYLEAGLADGIAGRHQVLEAEGLEDAPELPIGRYLQADPTRLGLRNGPRIALIFSAGTLVQSGGSPIMQVNSSDRIAAALEKAAEDESIRAIVLRVNSPGGSSLASDQLWRAIRRAREKKPVIASLGETAASGGYYIASGADAIVAEPATLTGSIGVYLLRPSLAGLYEKLGIRSELIARGPHAAVGAGDAPLTPEQRARAETWVRSIYGEFLDRVAEGRGLEREQVDAVGQGRVWLASRALEHGLIDELGGMREAVARAKVEADIPDDVDPRRVVLPGPRSLSEQVAQLLSGELPAWLRARWLPARLPPALDLDWPSLSGELLMLPPYWIELH